MSSTPQPVEASRPTANKTKPATRHIRFDATHRLPQPILAALRGQQGK
jgi:hypothetical protein